MICELLRSGVFLLKPGVLKVLAVNMNIGLLWKQQWSINCLLEQDWLVRGGEHPPETHPVSKRKYFLIKNPVDDKKQKC